MPTIDERCFGHEPAQTQLKVLRFTLNQCEDRNVRYSKKLSAVSAWLRGDRNIKDLENILDRKETIP